MVYLQSVSMPEVGFGPFEQETLRHRPGVVLFRGEGGGCLRAVKRGQVDVTGQGGALCHFQIVPKSADCVQLASASNPQMVLAMIGERLTLVESDGSPSCSFKLVSTPPPLASLPGAPPPLRADEDFSQKDYETFVTQGYVIARGVVDPEIVARALKASKKATELQANKDPEIAGVILDSPRLTTLVQRLVGPKVLLERVRCQIARRVQGNRTEFRGNGYEWHCDGMQRDEHSPFTLLLGVALTDQTEPGSGQLIVFPGSHTKVFQSYKERVKTHGGTLFETGRSPGKPQFFNGIDVNLRAGDAVLAHQKTAHAIGIRTVPGTRYQLYWRLSHHDREQSVEDGSVLDDLFSGFDGLKQNYLGNKAEGDL